MVPVTGLRWASKQWRIEPPALSTLGKVCSRSCSGSIPLCTCTGGPISINVRRRIFDEHRPHSSFVAFALEILTHKNKLIYIIQIVRTFVYLLRSARTSSTTSSLKGQGTKPILFKRRSHWIPVSCLSTFSGGSQPIRLTRFRAQIRSRIKRSLLVLGKFSSRDSNKRE